MKPNVFWSIVGAIVVAWIAFMGYEYTVYSEYEEQSQALQAVATDLEKLVKGGADKLPTAGLLAKREEYFQSYEEELNKVEKFYADRDNNFEKLDTSQFSSWQAARKDDFANLEKKYREVAGLDADAKLGFKELSFTDASQIVPYQRQWHLQRTLIEEIIAVKGTIEALSFPVLAREATDKAESSHFKKIPINLEASLAPHTAHVFLDRLLTHPFINFEIERWGVGKRGDALKYDVVEQVKAGVDPGPEPMVRVYLTAFAMNWEPPASPEKEKQ
ncbi:MAG: hypothetical protein ACKVX7_18760 [Planctomycetota bacterium]